MPSSSMSMLVRSEIMAAAPSLMTVDEYYLTPETVLPAELAFGVLHVADAPSPWHQSAVARLFRALDDHVRAEGTGEMWIAPLDVVLDASRALILQPDLLYISNDRSAIVQERIYGSPDLTIEVLSPSARVGRVDDHLGWLTQYGVRECWLIDLERKGVTVVTMDDRRMTRTRVVWREPISSTVLPRFERSLQEILEDRP
jgi:Uma2 family endonuclease